MIGNQIALGDKNDTARFYYDPEFGDSSLIANGKYKSSYDIEVQMLDKYLIDMKLPDKIKLLKLEAEGFEPEILRGAKSILGKVEYIAVDVGFERGTEQESTAPVRQHQRF